MGAGGILAIGVSILWITAITNAFNFLDNMDGLSAGIAAVCTTSFLITALSIGQWFVAAALALFSTLETTTAHATVDLNVKYVRPLHAGETYQVRGWVVERTRSLAICDAQVTDAAGKLYAKATTTFVIRS